MDLQTISQVSKKYNISTRTLRYYEQIGLIKSSKTDEYAYRMYDESSLNRLEQIILLRKLRITLKDIQVIIQNEDAVLAIQVFRDKIHELSEEITALATIKTILIELIDRLKHHLDGKMKITYLADESLLKIIDSLTVTKINFKEDTSMEDLKQANKQLSKLKDVRIVYLPPATVASIHHIGGLPELTTQDELMKFMNLTGLHTIKKDLRHYGFNHPNGTNPDGSDHGYERWVTIPDHFIVQEPFVKKEFNGGLYAAHMIPMGNFEEWQWLIDWVNHHDEYEINWGTDDCMSGLIEEHLNYIHLFNSTREEIEKWQLDLLLPIRPKVKK